MALTHHSFDTIKCDISDCKDQFTSYAGPEEFWDIGWHSENIFGKDVCLCPAHSKKLEDFLGKENPYEDN